MKQTIIISYIKLAFIMLFIISSEEAVAQQADGLTRQCHIEVRKTMKLERFKQLSSGEQKRVNEKCKQGDIGSAIRYVMRIGEVKRCMYDLNTYMKKNNLVVTKDVESRAYSQCRRGDLRKAIAEVSKAYKPPRPANSNYKRCVRDLDSHIRKNRLKVSKDAHDRAKRYCGRGDLRKAIAEVSKAYKPPRPANSNYKRCVRDLDSHIRKNRLKVSKDAHDRAKRYCGRGDLRKAIAEVERM